MYARYLIPDPDVSVLVKFKESNERRSNVENFMILDRDFIHIPKSVEEYESRTDIMGIDLGSTRCVLAISRNREIQVIPIDRSAPGDLWTESVISFDQEQPIIGKAAMTRLKSKPKYVIFDGKLISNSDHRQKKSEKSVWPFKFSAKRNGELFFEVNTSTGLQKYSLAKINEVFLKQIAKAASEYQGGLTNNKSVEKAVITVPSYLNRYKKPHIMISYAIEAAKSAGIEIIDVIEETHADLLYYLSREEYSEMIKPGMKIAIFDIGGGTCICRVYEISEHKGKRYAACFREVFRNTNSDGPGSGRDIDDIIVEELEKSIPEELRKKFKLRILEAAKEIKHELSVNETKEFNMSEINFSFDRIVEFKREWLENKLKLHFHDQLYYNRFLHYTLPNQRKLRRNRQDDISGQYSPSNNTDLVFLAGGTCRIPFIQKWIKELFSGSKVIIDKELEIITATGAALHALQVLSGEVKPYIKLIEQGSNEWESDKEYKQPEVESCSQINEEKEYVPSNSYNLNREAPVDYGQATVTSVSQVNIVQRTWSYGN